MMYLRGHIPHGVRFGVTCLGIVTTMMLAGCGASVAGTTATPTSALTSTATTIPATPTPTIPTLRYKIVTLNGGNGPASVALPVNAGTNFQWTSTHDFQGLTCQSAGTADPGGAPGRVVYQAFVCQLATGKTSGTGSYILAETGSSTPERIAQIELDRGSGTQGSNQNLSYQITTSAQLNGSASVALARSSGTNFQWSPAKGATGLTWQSEGLADPGGPPGHTEYQVFTGVLATGQTSGHGSVIFAEVGSNTPEATTQVTLMLGQ